MSRRRFDITNKQVLDMLANTEKYRTKQAVAEALGCTATLVQSVIDGKRQDKPYEKKKKEICQCCKLIPIGKNLRFLCLNCFRNKSHLNDTEYKIVYPKDRKNE